MSGYEMDFGASVTCSPTNAFDCACCRNEAHVGVEILAGGGDAVRVCAACIRDLASDCDTAEKGLEAYHLTVSSVKK